MSLVTDEIAALNSTNLGQIRLGWFRKKDGSSWLTLTVCDGEYVVRWVPSLQQLHAILRVIAACEDERYPPPAKGRGALLDFLRDSLSIGDYSRLAAKHHIPERAAGRVVNSNGADLSRPKRVEW